MAIEPDADNFISGIRINFVRGKMPRTPDNFFMDFNLIDDELHTPEKPFCYSPRCSCHENELLIFQVFLHVQDGLMTPDEATDFVKGKGI